MLAMSIDRGDSHYDTAGSWEKACRHIALFLWWAAERGLAAGEDETHDPDEIAKAPTKYFIQQCDTKLWHSDLTAEGDAFAKAEYSPYLTEVSSYGKQIGVGDYEIPESPETAEHFFAWLDERLAKWRRLHGSR